MILTGAGQGVVKVVAAVLCLCLASCGFNPHDGTRRAIIEYRSNVSVTDSLGAKAVFEKYVLHLRETNAQSPRGAPNLIYQETREHDEDLTNIPGFTIRAPFWEVFYMYHGESCPCFDSRFIDQQGRVFYLELFQ